MSDSNEEYNERVGKAISIFSLFQTKDKYLAILLVFLKA